MRRDAWVRRHCDRAVPGPPRHRYVADALVRSGAAQEAIAIAGDSDGFGVWQGRLGANWMPVRRGLQRPTLAWENDSTDPARVAGASVA